MADVAGLRASRAIAVDDTATFARLSGAAKETLRLASAISSAQDALTAYAIAEARADLDKLFSKFGDITVTVTTPAGEQPNAIQSRYTIVYDARAYHANTRQSDFAKRTVNGFGALDREAMAYLVTRKPEAIPSIIMDLAPETRKQLLIGTLRQCAGGT
ncbi:hypothetical protein D3Y57_16790 [Sphingomonas paeninsulae]|uniref:Uncharacterized protein n=2 Tax=Sphingomonas paeninsulae TaxID=2319844 RepID=A0A494TP84_SPHPE|nr:hypothetical protein D3Y57_16790 [Sphingomonas paeninsulae]